MAIACLRLVTFLPERPLRNVPRLRSRMTFSTFFDAFLLYFLAMSAPSDNRVVRKPQHETCQNPARTHAPMDNPYKPTATSLKEPPPQPRSPILAVLVGLVVDLGGTTIASIVLATLYAATLAGRGMPVEQITEAVTEFDPASGYGLVAMLVGGGFSLLGGYVCARMARRNERKVTGVLAVVSATLGFLSGGEALGWLLNVGLTMLTLARVMAGGELGRRRNLANARDAAATAA